ncbi:MAG TPA: hypothetical protein VHY35_14035 [Stellaceae bacterium]|nr:hypothetical protein [Stellaceae bacterium]
MRKAILAATLLLASAGSAAFGQSSNDVAPSKTVTPSGPTAPTISSTSPETQNPAVNPNAAGTQMGWHGYAATPGGPTNRASTNPDGKESGTTSKR